MISPPARQIRSAVQMALDEDLALGDVTTAILFPEPVLAKGDIMARQPVTLAGIAVARLVFGELDESLRVLPRFQDGQKVKAGSIVLTVEGDARSILMGERVALNFLQHLSGIATLTARFLDILRGHHVKILDTRKTLPGLRALEKWAVRLGGGMNHRQTLGDGILVKDNHLALLRAQHIGLAAACRLARERCPHGQRVVVEAQSLEEVQEALDGGADVILVDNLKPQSVRRAVELVKGRAVVEVSGGITLDNAFEMGATGVQALSIGALTHSAPAADFNMDIVPLERKTKKARRVKL